ncbi:MAG: hypothetical protein ACRD5Z_05250 [Bryobacteraceae bacterium]
MAKQLLVVAGVASALPIVWTGKAKALPEAPAHVVAVNTSRPTGPDPRAVRLRRFLSKLHCPVAVMSEDFVHAADDNHLDWRLLPSIAVIESSGGKAYKNNNIFGWRNGDEVFPTVRAGLNHVAYKLGRSPLYRSRSVLGKLRLYNPNEEYPGNVMAVMNRISPVADSGRRAETVLFQQNEYVYAD